MHAFPIEYTMARPGRDSALRSALRPLPPPLQSLVAVYDDDVRPCSWCKDVTQRHLLQEWTQANVDQRQMWEYEPAGKPGDQVCADCYGEPCHHCSVPIRWEDIKYSEDINVCICSTCDTLGDYRQCLSCGEWYHLDGGCCCGGDCRDDDY